MMVESRSNLHGEKEERLELLHLSDLGRFGYKQSNTTSFTP